LEPLRALLDAHYVTTRDVADAGWMPRQLQVGLTGRSIAPRLYVGVAMRGDYNHLVGLQRAEVLVCVNNNRRASIFRGGVDVAVLADWHEFIPALEATLRRELG
jgi:electron transfer flavoprotein alpha subunit